MMAATGPQSTLALVEDATSTFAVKVQVNGRDTPFSNRQLELMASEFEGVFNALSDDTTLSFVSVEEMESSDSDADADGDRMLRRRYLWMLRGRVHCSSCNQRKPRVDLRRLGESHNRHLGESEIEIDVTELVMKKFGQGLQDLFDGVTSVELSDLR